MTFREFLEIKNAQAIVEHIETLSDAEARELIDQLDESTIELIEALLDEGIQRDYRVVKGLEKRIKRETDPIKRAKLKDQLGVAQEKQQKGLRQHAIRTIENNPVDSETGEILGSRSRRNENLMKAVHDKNETIPVMKMARYHRQLEAQRQDQKQKYEDQQRQYRGY